MSRKHNAFAAGIKQAEGKKAVDPSKLHMGGNWSKLAFDQMEQRLQEVNGALARAEEATYQGILEGVVPVTVPVDQIIDDMGSDRFEPEAGDDTESLESLIDNIRQRGLRTPLRVRPKNPDWRPSPTAPRDMGDNVFLLQSGRRRLAACRHLGVDPIVFLSFADPQDAVLDDLHERFFENATRKNLTAVEKLYSIGLIAERTAETTQAQIAEMLGTSAAQVSRGVAVVKYFDQLQKDLDIAHATRDEIDAALKKYRDKDRTHTPDAARKHEARSKARASLPFRTRNLKHGQARLGIDGDGRRVLTLRDSRLDDARIDRILSMLEDD